MNKEEGPERVKTQKLKEETVADIIAKVRQDYPETKSFKNVDYSQSQDYKKRIVSVHKKELECSVTQNVASTYKAYTASDELKGLFDDDEPEEEDFVAFILKQKDYFIYCMRAPFTEDSTTFVVTFYNDVEDLKKFYSTELVLYKPGVYQYSKGMFGPTLVEFTPGEDEEPILESDAKNHIIAETKKFFDSEDFYKKHKLPFKRGLLMYGPPGNGKTSLIKAIAKQVKKSYTIVIDCSGNDIDSSTFEFITEVLGKSSHKILVFEDIDSLQYGSKSAFLNFLDGLSDIHNVYAIATTNHVDRLDDAIVQRPSRFDKVIHIGLPNDKVREKLLLRFFPTLDKDILSQCVKESESFSGAYFKELFIYCMLNGVTVDVAIKSLKKQMKELKDYDTKAEYFG